MIPIIVRAVADAWQLAVDEMIGESRADDCVHARWVAMLLMREAGASTGRIGRALGHRNHTTIMYGLRCIAERMEASPELRARVEAVRQAVRSRPVPVVTKPPAPVQEWARESFLARVRNMRDRDLMAPAIANRLGVPLVIINAVIGETERKDAA